MPLPFRVVLGCLALAGAGFTLPALQTGAVYNQNWALVSKNDDPDTFRILVYGRMLGIAVCAWLASGYTGQDFWSFLGLGSYLH